MIPGSNILAQALSVIGSTTVKYCKALARTTNAVGQYVTQYDEGVCISGSLQPVPRSMYAQLELDFSKQYYMFYTTTPIRDVERDETPDKIVYLDAEYVTVSRSDWNNIDGWNGVMFVKVTP